MLLSCCFDYRVMLWGGGAILNVTMTLSALKMVRIRPLNYKLMQTLRITSPYLLASTKYDSDDVKAFISSINDVPLHLIILFIPLFAGIRFT